MASATSITVKVTGLDEVQKWAEDVIATVDRLEKENAQLREALRARGGSEDFLLEGPSRGVITGGLPDPTPAKE